LSTEEQVEFLKRRVRWLNKVITASNRQNDRVNKANLALEVTASNWRFTSGLLLAAWIITILGYILK
jgi:hypothetical protein